MDNMNNKNTTSRIYILASIPCQGKTTTALLLEKYFRERNLKVACLQMDKGYFDVHSYIENDCYHYTIPLEATKTWEDFERCIPAGFDVYLLEITFAYSPKGMAYIDLFNNVNEVISHYLKDEWQKSAKNAVLDCMRNHYMIIDGESEDSLMVLWDLFHKRNVKIVYTKSPVELEGPYVNAEFELVNPEEFVYEEIKPQYQFPYGTKKAIAVGAFPAEYWDIFPDLKWFGFDYAGFMERFRKEDYDLAVIGKCMNKNLKFYDRPKNCEVVCYQPSVYINFSADYKLKTQKDDFMEVFKRIKSKKPGSPIGSDEGMFGSYNNKYWTYRTHPDFDIIKKEGNIVFCNGWILPQYLIRDGFLEVE